MELIAEGAEARIYSTDVKGLACVLKDRIEKRYRLPQIDERLRRLRTRHEASLLARAARVGVNVPKVIDVSLSKRFGVATRRLLSQESSRSKGGKGGGKEMLRKRLEQESDCGDGEKIGLMRSGLPSEDTVLCIEEISGPKVRDYLLQYSGLKDKVVAVCGLVGKQVAKMHHADITHGDLTTSNMIFTGDKVFLIDFGLGQVSTRLEDKAVDVHLLKECLRSKHFQVWELAWRAFRGEYESLASGQVFEQLRLVESRGRYKRLE